MSPTTCTTGSSTPPKAAAVTEKDHNDGHSKHTAKFIPWKLAPYFAFADEKTAIAFEQDLKSGSGKAFLKRRLLPKH